MKDVFEAAGIAVTSSNRKGIDKAIHRVVGVSYKDCPTTWKKLKQELAGDEKKTAKFVRRLKKALAD